MFRLNALSLTIIVRLGPFRSDVGYEGYKAYSRGPSPIEAANFSESTRIGMLVVKRAVFQSIASMCVHCPERQPDILTRTLHNENVYLMPISLSLN